MTAKEFITRLSRSFPGALSTEQAAAIMRWLEGPEILTRDWPALLTLVQEGKGRRASAQGSLPTAGEVREVAWTGGLLQTRTTIVEGNTPTCRKCNGTGRDQTCQACHGSGRSAMRCSECACRHCGGAGVQVNRRTGEERDCPHCDRGIAPPNGMICDRCWDSGFAWCDECQPCGACDGLGQHYRCKTCRDTRLVRAKPAKLDGIMYTFSAPCPECHASAKR